MRAAVTGAGGFIGSALTARLLELGWDVAALDLPRALGHVPPGARRIGVDIRNQSALREALRGVQVLFHTAALFDLTAAWEDLYAVNVEGVGQVCAAARARGVERIITWSSSSVYGGTERPEPLTENALVPFERLNPYARSKWLGELLAREAAITDGLDVIVVRPGEVYGPGSAKGLGQALFALTTGAMGCEAARCSMSRLRCCGCTPGGRCCAPGAAGWSGSSGRPRSRTQRASTCWFITTWSMPGRSSGPGSSWRGPTPRPAFSRRSMPT